MRLRLPLCLFNRHVPWRNRAKWDGAHFVGVCTACGRPIRRREKGRWERDWIDPANAQGHTDDRADQGEGRS